MEKRRWRWVCLTLAGLTMGATSARAQEAMEQGTEESQDLPARAEEREAPPVRAEATPARPAMPPLVAPAPTVPATVSPTTGREVIGLEPWTAKPVTSPAPSPISPPPQVTPPPQAPAAAPPALPPTPVAPASGQSTLGLPAIPTRYATKGLTEIEGGLNFSYVRLSRGSSATFALDPAIRLFVADGLAVGGALELRVIKDGPKSFSLLPGGEYNFSFGDGRLFEFIMLGLGVRYVTSGGASSTHFLFRPGLGTKLTFGGGLIALGLAMPIAFSDPVEVGLDIMTRYAIFF